MRQLLLFTFICLFAANVQAQSKKDIRLYKIKGVTETTVVYEGGKEVANYRSEVKKFDKEGNVIENITYNRDGSVRRKEAAKYSGKDKIEEVSQDVNNQKKSDNDEEDNGKYKHITWKYNSNGDKTEEIWYNEKGVVIKKIVFYNARGDRQSEISYDAAGKVLKKTVYSYDAKGLRTDKKVYGPGEVLQKHIKYTYSY